ncbi:peptidase M50B-like-domain-containing protein [Thamnocephalis sphaerospora]|uniref:Peptidase M50B-like-domain-containing protein n=1 Tax=Thamnocephalis sphaerospora TaxID=78915 RepID=A0A4P9XY17_9FUNG|nr:peptidase M50B-like-domain-containing protein [Thamnocephalis sphaerospora]|eukprot:RKP10320.1 peptidase M50B-like-domain-containing protein [Thamnocephalis sphaerospora]
MANQSFVELITPNEEQKTTLIIIGVYILAILILWNVPILKTILYPFKLVTVALHEFGHAAAGCCTGAKIEAIEVDPEEGGVTRMRGGSPCCTLPAGYLGSSFFGALMIFAGFDVLASKVVSVIIGICLLATLWWARNWLTRGVTLLFIGLIVVLWLVKDAVGLKYFVLFMGVMSCLYSLWDIVEDLVVRKVNESDATKFAKYTGCCVPQFWGLVWFLISLVFLAAAVLAGIAVFRDRASASGPGQ